MEELDNRLVFFSMASVSWSGVVFVERGHSFFSMRLVATRRSGAANSNIPTSKE